MAEDFTPRYESYPDRLIREAMERGDFADNPLRGKPVKLGRPGEQKSWIQERLEREDLSGILVGTGPGPFTGHGHHLGPRGHPALGAGVGPPG